MDHEGRVGVRWSGPTIFAEHYQYIISRSRVKMFMYKCSGLTINSDYYLSIQTQTSATYASKSKIVSVYVNKLSQMNAQYNWFTCSDRRPRPESKLTKIKNKTVWSGGLASDFYSKKSSIWGGFSTMWGYVY